MRHRQLQFQDINFVTRKSHGKLFNTLKVILGKKTVKAMMEQKRWTIVAPNFYQRIFHSDTLYSEFGIKLQLR